MQTESSGPILGGDRGLRPNFPAAQSKVYCGGYVFHIHLDSWPGPSFNAAVLYRSVSKISADLAGPARLSEPASIAARRLGARGFSRRGEGCRKAGRATAWAIPRKTSCGLDGHTHRAANSARTPGRYRSYVLLPN